MNHAVKSMRSPLKLGMRLLSSPAVRTRGSRAKAQNDRRCTTFEERM